MDTASEDQERANRIPIILSFRYYDSPIAIYNSMKQIFECYEKVLLSLEDSWVKL